MFHTIIKQVTAWHSTVLLELLQMYCTRTERCFAKERQSQTCHFSQMKVLKVIFHLQFLEAVTTFGSGISEYSKEQAKNTAVKLVSTEKKPSRGVH